MHVWSLVINLSNSSQSLVAIYTPIEVIKNPKTSNVVKFSFKNNQAMIAEVVGIRKNIDTVLLAEFFLIKNIKIVKAPNETMNI